MGQAPTTESGDSGFVPPPPPPPPPLLPLPPRRLYRRRDNRVLAGVASGLADYLGADPVWIRVAFVAATFFGGIGILAYLVAWVAMPVYDFPGPVGGGPARVWGPHADARLVVGVGLLLLAALVLAGSLSSEHWGLVWGAVLVAAGVLLVVEARWPAGAERPGPPPYADWTPPTVPAMPPSSGWGGTAQAAALPISGFGPGPGAAAPIMVRRAFPTGLATTAAVLLAIGIAALLDNLGLVTISPAAGFGLVLLVIGAGLVAGFWLGRSWWLIALGLILLPFAAAATVINEPLTGGTGQIRYAPPTVSAIRPEYHLAAGQLIVDLSQVQLGSAAVPITVTDAAGQVIVIVPSDADVQVTASAGAGELRVLGHVDSGYQVSSRVSSPATGASTGVLDIDVSVGVGQVTVEQGAPTSGSAS